MAEIIRIGNYHAINGYGVIVYGLGSVSEYGLTEKIRGWWRLAETPPHTTLQFLGFSAQEAFEIMPLEIKKIVSHKIRAFFLKNSDLWILEK